MSNAPKNFDILATGLNVMYIYYIHNLLYNYIYIIILIVWQNYFSDVCPAKILELSKPFFPCINVIFTAALKSYMCYGIFNYCYITR